MDYRTCRCGAKIDHDDTIGLVNHVMSQEHEAGVAAKGLEQVTQSENATEWKAAERMSKEKCRCGHPRSDHARPIGGSRFPCRRLLLLNEGIDRRRCYCGNFKESAYRPMERVNRGPR